MNLKVLWVDYGGLVVVVRGRGLKSRETQKSLDSRETHESIETHKTLECQRTPFPLEKPTNI